MSFTTRVLKSCSVRGLEKYTICMRDSCIDSLVVCHRCDPGGTENAIMHIDPLTG